VSINFELECVSPWLTGYSAVSAAVAAGDFQFVDIVVGFNATDINREPVCVGGSLVIANGQKSASVLSLFDVIRYKPSTDRGTYGFNYSGPWTITVLTDSNPDSLVALLNADPLVDYAELVQHAGDPNDVLAGEGTRTWFPPSSKNEFCNQFQMHHRLASEDTVLVDDPCSLSGILGPIDHDMDLPQAWGISKGDSSVVVAIIDTGCDIIHPNLGGEGPVSTVSDSMACYNQGIWFRNWLEQPGDANADGFPGEYGVDDDGDGLFDEDSAGREPGNLAEADIITGNWSTCTALTVTDASANWVPNSLVGMRFYGATQEGEFDSGLYEMVTSNTNNSITTSGAILLNRLIASNKNGWAYISTSVGTQAYKIGDGIDNDADGFVDDLGYLANRAGDDDENGFVDDFHGWDFIDGFNVDPRYVACPNDDMIGQDNDPRTLWDHGTAVASQVASTIDSGAMMGGAPRIKVLPLRVLGDYVCGSVYGYRLENLAAAVNYARMMGADIISLSFSTTPYWDHPSFVAALQAAMSDGITVVASAGNSGSTWDWPAYFGLESMVVVAGLDELDHRYYTSSINQSSYGTWVDVSARGWNILVALSNIRPIPGVPLVEHGYGHGWTGTSLSSPTVSAVAGLVKSVYPNWTTQEAMQKVQSSIDDIYAPGMNDPYIGMLGTGRVNGYKALTFYGDVPATADTTWAHNIWIGGDIHVPVGRTLTVAAGETVRVAIDDLLSARNPNEIEFVIDGTLQINGTTSAPVVFESFGGSHPQWTYDHAITISGETFTCGGLGCAEIASAASCQLMPGVSASSQVFAVTVTPVVPLSGVTVDLGGLGLTGTTLSLLDNGTGEDLVAGDHIYTSSAFAAALAPGAYSVSVSANAVGGGSTRRSVSVEVPELVAKFTDVSSQVGLNYTGKPYSAMNGKIVTTGQSGMAVTTSDSDSPVYRTEIALPSGSPYFSSPIVNLVEGGARGLAAADFDNDGDEDIFVASAQSPKLWRNDSGTYVDVTSAMGLATLASNAASACWGDYDNDGWLDLFVTRCTAPGGEPPTKDNIEFEQHRLFRNLCGSSCGFLDVTSAAGFLVPYTPVGLTAAWGDLEGDGDLDLIVPDLSVPGYSNTALYVNNGNGTFANERESRFTGSAPWGHDFEWGTGVVWADMDNDEDLDLVVSCAGPGSCVLINNGQGEFPAELKRNLSTSADEYSGVQVLDHNLDGWPDILLLSGVAEHASRLFLGRSTVDGVEFVEGTHNAGLAHTSSGMGVLAADFTADGDADVFVGRRLVDGQYFYKTDGQSGANSLDRRYVKVRLVSPTTNNVNRQGIGAVVSVTAGGMVQSQIVDGGSGRGGQSDRTLTFGLGDYAGQVTATVRWPGGVEQSDVELVASGAGAIETVNVISDAAPVVSNVNVATYIVPGISFYDWEFSWDTDVACRAAGDVVTFIQDEEENPCWPGWVTVSPSIPGVVYTYAAKAGGGYTHKLRVNHEPCNLGCSFHYTATSDTGLHSVTSTPPKLKKIKFCPAEY
jgi:hypothetical protein